MIITYVDSLPVLVWRFDRPRLTISSAPYGGGVGERGWVLNATVPSGYDRPDPDRHVSEIAGQLKLTGPGTGLLTAVDVRKVVSVTERGVTADVTTGVGVPTWAAAPDAAGERIGTINAGSHDLVLETLVSDRMSAICRRDHRFATRDALSWDEVIKEPCISVIPQTGIRELVDSTLARKGIRFAPRWQVSFLTTALSMTAHCLGTSILPGYLVPHLQYPVLVAVPLKAPVVRRKLSAISRSGSSLSPAARAFIELIKRESAGASNPRRECLLQSAFA